MMRFFKRKIKNISVTENSKESDLISAKSSIIKTPVDPIEQNINRAGNIKKGWIKKSIPHPPEDYENQDAEFKHALIKSLNTEIPKYPPENMPFFIIGSVRSGTTLLRDLLRDHPRLECPEETHFFRWADPFGSPRYKNQYRTKLFRRHREIDQIDQPHFHMALTLARTKEHLSYEYGQEFLKQRGQPDNRLFDKTPQNVYGMFFINAIYPEAKFIHIYRHPFNVVTSLMEGKVMPKHSFQGAINYWVESMILIKQFKRFLPDLLLEIKYEDVCQDPDPSLISLLSFVGEDPSLLPSQKSKAHREKNKYRDKLSQEQMDTIRFNCEPYFSQYGYE